MYSVYSNSKSHPKMKIAKEDIICYKVLERSTTKRLNKFCFSYYSSDEEEIFHIGKRHINTKKLRFNCKYENRWHLLGGGIQSYMKLEDAIKMGWYYTSMVFCAIIPKGTKYYEVGINWGEVNSYYSKELIITKDVKYLTDMKKQKQVYIPNNEKLYFDELQNEINKRYNIPTNKNGLVDFDKMTMTYPFIEQLKFSKQTRKFYPKYDWEK